MKEDFSDFFEKPLEALEKKDYFLEEMDSDIYIDDTAKIKNPVVIEGPVYIGPYCEIGPFSYLRPGTYLEGKNHIGNSEIKNSLLLENTKVPAQAGLIDEIQKPDPGISPRDNAVGKRPFHKRHIHPAVQSLQGKGSLVCPPLIFPR